MHYVRLLIPPLLCLLSCATEPTPTPSFDYGGLREPASFAVQKTDPVVPPQSQPEPEPPKDPCADKCKSYNDLDRECDRLAKACQRMFEAQGHMRGETCQNKDKACKRVIEFNLGSCSC